MGNFGIVDDTKSGIKSALGDLGGGLTTQLSSAPKDIAKTAVKQVGLENIVERKSPESQAESAAPATDKATTAVQEKDRKDLLEQLYGPSKPPEQPATNKAAHTANLQEQVGLKTPDTTISTTKQLGLEPNHNTASLESQLGLKKEKTPEEVQALQKQQTQHNQEYFHTNQVNGPTYTQEVNNAVAPEQSEVIEAQEKQETEQQRMERLHQEDLQKKQEEDKKKQPIAVLRGKNAAESGSRDAMG